MTENVPPQYPGSNEPGQGLPSYGSVPPPEGGYPPPAAGGYPPPGYYPTGPGGYGPKGNQLALWSMIVGIGSIPLLCCYIGFFSGIAAVVMGFISRNQINQSQGMQTGAGQALAGIICGFVAIGLAMAMFVAFFAIGFSGGWDSY